MPSGAESGGSDAVNRPVSGLPDANPALWRIARLGVVMTFVGLAMAGALSLLLYALIAARP